MQGNNDEQGVGSRVGLGTIKRRRIAERSCARAGLTKVHASVQVRMDGWTGRQTAAATAMAVRRQNDNNDSATSEREYNSRTAAAPDPQVD